MNDPLITVAMSTYNRKDLLRRSLDSVLRQTWKNIEIILVDDGSSDGTGDMIRTEYPDVKYFYKENGGDASAKNLAMQKASGKYLIFHDSDDLMFDDCIEVLYNAIKDKGNAVAYGEPQPISATGEIKKIKSKMKHYPSGDILPELFQHVIVHNCGTLIPLKNLHEVENFLPFTVGFDYDLFLRLSMSLPFYSVSRPVVYRRRHSENLSTLDYKKAQIMYEIVSSFYKSHPEIHDRIPLSSVHSRYANLIGKIAREAYNEHLDPQIVEKHLFEAWHYSKFSLKMFSRYFFWKVFRKFLG